MKAKNEGFTRRGKSNPASALALQQGRQAGFTLVELMITIAVGAILLMIAVPSFRDMILTQRLSTTTDNMVIAINTARMEAIKRNADVQFCSNSAALNGTDLLGSACSTNIGAVYAADNATPPNIAQVLNTVNGLGSSVQLVTGSNVIALRFKSQGVGFDVSDLTAPFIGAVAELCVSQLSRNNIYTIQMTNGAILEVIKSTGACP